MFCIKKPVCHAQEPSPNMKNKLYVFAGFPRHEYSLYNSFPCWRQIVFRAIKLMPNRLLATYSYTVITTGTQTGSLTIISMHHPPQLWSSTAHASQSAYFQFPPATATSAQAHVPSLPQEWEAALSHGPAVFPPTHTQCHWWAYLTPLPLDGYLCASLQTNQGYQWNLPEISSIKTSLSAKSR